MTTNYDVVVFDTNVFRKGLPSVKKIDFWAARLGVYGAKLWLPEVVVWELASHTVELISDFRTKLKSFSDLVNSMGMSIDVKIPEIEAGEIVRLISGSGAVIIPLDGDSAQVSLRNQIFGQGGGSRKAGIKTGAADSAIVQSVLRYAKESKVATDRILWVSANSSDLSTAWGSSDGQLPPIAIKANTRELDFLYPPRDEDSPLDGLSTLAVKGEPSPNEGRMAALRDDLQAQLNGEQNEILAEFMRELIVDNWPDDLDAPEEGPGGEWQTGDTLWSAVNSEVEHIEFADSESGFSASAEISSYFSVGQCYDRQDINGDLPEFLEMTGKFIVHGLLYGSVQNGESSESWNWEIYEMEVQEIEFVPTGESRS